MFPCPPPAAWREKNTTDSCRTKRPRGYVYRAGDETSQLRKSWKTNHNHALPPPGHKQKETSNRKTCYAAETASGSATAAGGGGGSSPKSSTMPLHLEHRVGWLA